MCLGSFDNLGNCQLQTDTLICEKLAFNVKFRRNDSRISMNHKQTKTTESKVHFNSVSSLSCNPARSPTHELQQVNNNPIILIITIINTHEPTKMLRCLIGSRSRWQVTPGSQKQRGRTIHQDMFSYLANNWNAVSDYLIILLVEYFLASLN